MPSLRNYGLTIVLCVIWGMAFVAISVGDQQLNLVTGDNFVKSAVDMALLRWLITSACFLLLYPFIGKPRVPFEIKDAPRLIVVALASVGIYHISLYYAEQTVTASLAGVLISLAPLFSVVFSTLLLGEKLGRRLVLGLALAFAGSAIISSPDLNFSSSAPLGPPLVVISALASATFTVGSKPLVGKYGPNAMAVWAAVLGTVMLLPLASGGLFDVALRLPLAGWLPILYLSLLSTVVANLLFYTLLSRQSVSRLSVQLYLVPLVSVIGGVLLLANPLGPLLVGGGLVLLAGVALGTSRRP